MLKKSKILLAATAVAGLALTGCAEVTGGGYIASTGEDGRATFGFDLTCNENGFYVGSWVYHDRKAPEGPVRVTGTIPDGVVGCTESATEPGGLFLVEVPYTTQGKNPTSGEASIIGVDGNQGGNADMKNDFLGITLSEFGSSDAWYENDLQPVLGGNITATGVNILGP